MPLPCYLAQPKGHGCVLTVPPASLIMLGIPRRRLRLWLRDERHELLIPDPVPDALRMASPCRYGGPNGQISKILSSPQIKNISVFPKLKSRYISNRSVPFRGALAIVTDVGRDAVDACSAFDEWRVRRTAKSCGPGAPTLALSFADVICEATVARKPGHRGERVISRKTIAQGRPDCLR